MMTKKEFHRLQDRRVTKSIDAPVVVQLDSVSTSENPWWEARDQRGDVVMTMPFPKSEEALVEMMNGLVGLVAKPALVVLIFILTSCSGLYGPSGQ